MGIAGLLFEGLERHAAAIHPRGSAGFEPIGCKPQGLKRFGQPFSGLLAGSACWHRLVAHPDAPAQEGAGGEHHRLGVVDAAEIGAHAGDAQIPTLGATAGFQPRDHGFA